jgi:hypothetical protein
MNPSGSLKSESCCVERESREGSVISSFFRRRHFVIEARTDKKHHRHKIFLRSPALINKSITRYEYQYNTSIARCSLKSQAEPWTRPSGDHPKN